MGAAALSSCSRSNYAFNPAGPSYLGTTRAHATVAKSEPVLTASAETTESAALEPSARVTPASTRSHVAPSAHRVAARPSVAAAPVAVEAAAPAAHATLTKVERKEMKQALRQAVKQQKKAVSPNNTAAGGKSQIVAAILCFFLGGLGIHDFYLGYIGKGILQIFLSLILIGFILVIIDFVRILTGSLKPKGGEYEKTL